MNSNYDGLSGEDFFSTNKYQEGVTYGDILLLPGYIDFLPEEVSLSTKITRNITINTPILSSPMDTVTEASMAIAMALLGGLGVIHSNLTIEEQAKKVERVKRYENGFISYPIVLSPKHTIIDVLKIKNDYGFSGIPITEDGTLKTKLVGIVTNRDIDFEDDFSKSIEHVMTKDLLTARYGITLKEANEKLKSSKKGKLPIIDQNGLLVSLICRTDLRKNKDFPNATKDSQGRLRVAASVSTHIRDRERIEAVIEKGADILVIDSAQGYSSFQISLIQELKKKYPTIDIIAGNVVTRQQAEALIKAGADSLRIGMGPGSICITQETMACGRAQVSAIYSTALLAHKYNIPTIADGGIANIGDIIKAISVGASAVMMGSLLAGTSESPGEYFYKDGVRLKKYRGMASLEVMQSRGSTRYFTSKESIKVAQGVSGSVVDRGSVYDFLAYLVQGIKHGFQDLGHKNIDSLHKSLYNGDLRFEKRSLNAQMQGKAHNLYAYEKPIIGAD